LSIYCKLIKQNILTKLTKFINYHIFYDNCFFKTFIICQYNCKQYYILFYLQKIINYHNFYDNCLLAQPSQTRRPKCPFGSNSSWIPIKSTWLCTIAEFGSPKASSSQFGAKLKHWTKNWRGNSRAASFLALGARVCTVYNNFRCKMRKSAKICPRSCPICKWPMINRCWLKGGHTVGLL